MVLTKDGITKEGYGIIKYFDGSRYEGLFSLNNKHGRGKLFLNDGTVY